MAALHPILSVFLVEVSLVHRLWIAVRPSMQRCSAARFVERAVSSLWWLSNKPLVMLNLFQHLYKATRFTMLGFRNEFGMTPFFPFWSIPTNFPSTTCSIPKTASVL
ncbi:MAG: hypothetical protein QME52_11875 [Bacteroidota bacterium]|nr:hypothetical protein [Bacteroidota bacterium]